MWQIKLFPHLLRLSVLLEWLRKFPIIHRLLKKHDVDVDVMTAGEFKRTVTVLGENTEKGKQKFQAELEETHQYLNNLWLKIDRT